MVKSFPGTKRRGVASILLLAAYLLLFSAAGVRARRIPLVDVNRAAASRFQQLPGISRELALEIVAHRERVNFFNAVSELIEVEGIDRELLEEITPYLIITPPSDLRAAEIIEDLEIMEEEEEEYFLDLDVDISRLEAYRASPLDLNTAVYSQLMELPYIDSQTANAILSLRSEMRGFTSVRDIREIVGPYRFDRISAFITVLDEREPVRFHGDLRLKTEVRHPYHDYYFDLEPEYHYPLQVEGRYRLRYGNRFELGLQMRRKASAHWPPDYDGSRSLSYANFTNYFLGSRYLLLRNISLLDTVVLGSYRLDYFRALTRTRRLRGLRLDDRPAINSGFYGAAAELRRGGWDALLFVSDKAFAVGKINPYDGSVGVTQRSLYYTGNYPIFEPPYLNETLYGGIVRRDIGAGLVMGAGGYRKKFSRVIDPEADFRHFRGDEIQVLDLEAEYTYRNLRLLIDWGLSRYHTFDAFYDDNNARIWEEGRDWYWDSGSALRLTMVSDHPNGQFWAYYWNVDYDYYDLLGEGYDATYNGRNQIRYGLGGRVEHTRDMFTQAEIRYHEIIRQLDQRFVRDSQSVRIFYANTSQLYLRLRHSWDITPEFLIRYTGNYNLSRDWRTVGVRYSPMRDISHRMEITHRASDRIRLRGVFRLRRAVFEETGYIDNWDQRLGDNVSGNYGELRYRASSEFLLLSRIFVQEAGHGIGLLLRPEITFSRNSKIRMELEYEPRAEGEHRSIFALQYDMSW